MPTYLQHQVAANTTTIDATVTTAGNYTLPDETVVLAFARVYGRTSAGVAAVYIRSVGVQREGGGGAALVGAVNALHTGEDAGAAAWDCTLDVNTNDVRVRVTGAAATTIVWRTILEINLLTP